MDFNRYIDRCGTDCCKWDIVDKVFSDYDVTGAIPMWVADSDFLCPPEVVEAVIQRARDGVYGYNVAQPERCNNAVIGWMSKRYDWNVEKDWIVFTPGIVPALVHAVRALTEPGDGVIIQQPVYNPFKNSVVNNGRVLCNNALICDGDEYRMNFEQLEELAAQPRTKMMILCNPHNPVGRVWSREELTRVCEICARNDVVLVSDEIHADLIMKDVVFTSAGPVAQACGTKCVSCYAPSKTFNIAGLQSSAILIPDEQIRRAISDELNRSALPGMNVFAAVALEAAWTRSEYYIREVMDYIEANIDYAVDFIQKHMPKIKLRKPEGTYLGWMDLRGLELSDEETIRFFLERAKIAADPGSWFGSEGAGFMRVNFACHRSTLEKAMDQLLAAYVKEFN